MRRKSEEPEETPSRENYRYTIPLPMRIEIHLGMFKGKTCVPARPVDLALGGVACHVRPDPFFTEGKRLKIFIDGTAAFAEIRNLRTVEDGLLRIGMSFVQLELETQERIVDAIEQAKIDKARLNRG